MPYEASSPCIAYASCGIALQRVTSTCHKAFTHDTGKSSSIIQARRKEKIEQ